jgi:hypothetical protein
LAIWIALIPMPAAASSVTILPPVPDRIAPLPTVPRVDEEGMAFIGFSYRCEAKAGDGEFALKGKVDIGMENEILGTAAESGMIAANPMQVVKPGVENKPWEFIGTLRWKFYTYDIGYDVKAAGPYILKNTSRARMMLELTPQKSMPKSLVLAFTGRANGAALIAGGYGMNGIATFYLDPQELLGFDGPSWVVSKWPYQGEGVAIKNRYGSGQIKMDGIRAVLANIDPLNTKLGDMLKDYKNLCTPLPTYDDNTIII